MHEPPLPRPTPPPTPALQLSRIGGGLIGAALGFVLARHLPVVPSTLVSALVLAGGATLSSSVQPASQWWGLIGAATGTLLGTAWVLAAVLQQSSPEQNVEQRALTVVFLVLAEVIAGHTLSSNSHRPLDGRRPRDLLRSASALTTGVFAAIVTLTFIHSGLDPARTFSSRLSTSLTILVASVAAPGWLSHLLTQRHANPRDHA